MILKRTLAFTVTHPETGLIFEVFCVDCFCETHATEGIAEFTFEERFYETATGQRVVSDPKRRKDIWIVLTDKGNWYVQREK